MVHPASSTSSNAARTDELDRALFVTAKQVEARSDETFASLDPDEHLFELRHELRPAHAGAVIEMRLIRREAPTAPSAGACRWAWRRGARSESVGPSDPSMERQTRFAPA